jgi:SAM-dependent methyltransferase
MVDPLVVLRARSVTGASGVAIPPRRLRARTGAPGVREFLEGGGDAARELRGALGSAGRSLEDVGALLDFGCGSGRVLRHMVALTAGAQGSGCDVDARAIDWASRAYPDLGWAVSSSDPPLPFSSDSFDLVYSISVLSHLDEPRQDRWLTELRRVLRPGGAALLTVHGAYAFEQFRTGRVRTGWCPPEAFARAPLGGGEFAFVPYLRSPWNEADLPGVGGPYGLAFHGAEYVREHWGRTLSVLGVEERAMTSWQDIVVCMK